MYLRLEKKIYLLLQDKLNDFYGSTSIFQSKKISRMCLIIAKIDFIIFLSHHILNVKINFLHIYTINFKFFTLEILFFLNLQIFMDFFFQCKNKCIKSIELLLNPEYISNTHPTICERLIQSDWGSHKKWKILMVSNKIQ